MDNKGLQTAQEKIGEMEHMLKMIEPLNICRYDLSGGYDNTTLQYQAVFKATDEEVIKMFLNPEYFSKMVELENKKFEKAS